jgi:hypothetical protein
MSSAMPSQLGDFDLERWKQIGFQFRRKDEYPGHFLWRGTASFDGKSFSITFSIHEKVGGEYDDVMCIGQIIDDATMDWERHAVFQHDAAEWFSRKSQKFKSLWF